MTSLSWREMAGRALESPEPRPCLIQEEPRFWTCRDGLGWQSGISRMLHKELREVT